jgi:NCAIR mutase (PurE)-related protein
MKLRQAIKIVKSGKVIYAEKVKLLERKIKSLKLLALEMSRQKRKGDYNRIMAKAKQWQEILNQSFWNLKDKKNI